MTADEIRGRWEGTITGTNTGRFRIEITPVLAGLVIEAILDDDAGLNISLVARSMTKVERFGTITILAVLSDDGSLTGDWKTTVGTTGKFEAQRPAEQVPPAAQQQALLTASATEKRLRVPFCIVDVDSLKRRFAGLRTGADEAARIHNAKQPAAQQLPLERLNELYRVAIILRGAEGELILSGDVLALASEVLAKPLQSVEFDIGLYYRFAFNQQQPLNRATVVLDFTRPSAFDLSNPSGSPTPNNSSIAVYGAEPIWVSGVFERVRAILQQGVVRTGWLHGPHVYDVLAYVLGFPLALAAVVLAASRLPAPPRIDPRAFGVAIFVFAAITGLYGFRLAFSVTRWRLPYVEFASAPEPLHRRLRVPTATVVIGAIASLAAAAIWALFH